MPKQTFVPAMALVLVAGSAAAAQPHVAAVPPPVAAGMVRAYFDALGRLDAHTLDRVTTGQAAERTSEMLDRIRLEARRRDVGVELQVAGLAVSPLAADGPTRPVDVEFDIAVVAKKWIFSMVAEKLRGRATFYVGSNLARGDASGVRITGIKLFLD